MSRLVTPLDRAREPAVRRARAGAAVDGEAVVWYRTAEGALQPLPLAIQPGVADDLPSLLSSLAPLLRWPGAPAHDDLPGEPVAAWARVWQVREGADLRVELWWDTGGTPRCSATLRRASRQENLFPHSSELCALLDAVAATPVSSASPHGLLLAGNRAMQAEDFARARELYQRAVADLPSHVEARRNLALALARLGEWEAAAEAITAARALAPDDPALSEETLVILTNTGVSAAEAGELDRAAGGFLRILAIWPEEPTALANLGNIRLRQGRPREARAIFTRFLRLHPDHAVAKTIRLALETLGTDDDAGHTTPSSSEG